MGYYFDIRDSAAWLHGTQPEQVIRLMAARYMGDNPASPFVWRSFNETGIRCDRKARYHFDFDKRFPQALNGQIAFAAGDLFCPKAKGSNFIVECFSPLTLWLNGEKVFQSNGNQERSGTPCRFPVSLRAGYNRFVLRSECTRIGFGCTLQNAMPQWEPCNYVLPFEERAGEAGFLFTSPLPPETPLADGFWGNQEKESGIQWLPLAEKEREEAGRFYAWGQVNAEKKLTFTPALPCCVDGKRVEGEATLSFGKHDLVWYGTLKDIRRAVKALPCRLQPPVTIHGQGSDYLLLGPMEEASDVSSLLKMGIVKDGKTWQPDRRHIALRPYVEAALFGRWTYPLGVTLYGLLSAGRLLDEKAYVDYVNRHVHQVTDIHDYALWDTEKWGFAGVNQQLCWLDALDDCGSFGSLMLECDQDRQDPAIEKMADRIGQYMLSEQVRIENGAFCRRDQTIWADDMYMSGPFLCRYAERKGDMRPMEECAEQLLKYRDLLLMPEKKIMAHMMCLDHGKNNGIPWCRGNGWVIFSLSELLMRLDAEHPLRRELLQFFITLTQGYLALQDETGLWHQILDEEGTYPESSSTAMFICAFTRGLRLGWYPQEMRDQAEHAARRAWKGLTENTIDRSGNLYGVCQGSGFSFSRAYYRTLMWNFNDTHGIGIVMLAGVELMKLDEALKAQE